GSLPARSARRRRRAGCGVVGPGRGARPWEVVGDRPERRVVLRRECARRPGRETRCPAARPRPRDLRPLRRPGVRRVLLDVGAGDARRRGRGGAARDGGTGGTRGGPTGRLAVRGGGDADADAGATGATGTGQGAREASPPDHRPRAADAFAR
ncbi:MAG: hypothetical protein AVDCRST_MAG30-3880, partial [uncultured Solirubrobacteraceae bacterium]